MQAKTGGLFVIAFDKIFRENELAIFNEFEMSSRRNFKNLSKQIAESYYEILLNEDGELDLSAQKILYSILYARSTIIASETTTFENFLEILENVITAGEEQVLINIIDKFVEENYALSLDEDTENSRIKKRKVNVELQFSDQHAKTLLKIAYLYRILIPVISTYFCYNKASFNANLRDDETEIEDLEFDETNSKIFAYLFERVAKNPNALRNKLYKLTYSRIIKTTYSDKRFWTAAKNVGITKDSEALEIYKKVLTNAIPKFSIEKEKNIVSFLQSVINNQIDFLFQNKFKYKFTPLETTSENYGDDEDNLTEFEKLEILTSRKDEGSYILRKMNIEETVQKIPEKLGVGVSDVEVKTLLKTLNRNSIQEQIVSLITFKYFNDTGAIKYITFYNYCLLVIACKKFLEEHKFKYLPQILISNCEKHRERANIIGTRVRPQILASKKYRDLFEEKYSNFEEEIEKPFLAFIGTTYCSVFRDADGNELFDSSVKVAKIAEEILDLVVMTT